MNFIKGNTGKVKLEFSFDELFAGHCTLPVNPGGQ